MGASRSLVLLGTGWLGVFVLFELNPPVLRSACCYFSAKEKDVQQPGQKVFLTWDPKKHLESFTVQPRFEGNARDFGMVIPTPAKPQLDEMPRDFFKELAVFSILKRREQPQSRLVFQGWGLGVAGGGIGGFGGGMMGMGGGMMGGGGMFLPQPRRPAVQVLETGLVGSLNYKVLNAERADDLYDWLKNHDYRYNGGEATLDFYVKKKWFFTVMKIDAMQMKKRTDGTYAGQVTPTRFQFVSKELVYPLKITQLSVKEKTEALFYVQAPFKIDLPGDFTYQYQWVPLLDNARGWYDKGTFASKSMPGKGNEWLDAIKREKDSLLQRGEKLGYGFTNNVRPEPNQQGRVPTTLEYAKLLKAEDIQILRGEAIFTEKVPDVDQGFANLDLRNPARAQWVRQVIRQRLARLKQIRPGGFLVREAPEADIRDLRVLVGHLQPGQFLTKFRKVFTNAEMDDDLVLGPAKLGTAEDKSEYEEILPSSPP